MPAQETVADLYGQLPRTCLIEPPVPTEAPLTRRDQQLVEAAATILSEAEEGGKAVSQANLARRLRAAGHTIGNDRLAWLADATQRYRKRGG
ncbi:MAG: hypothetical protein JO345_08365 [Streptosporangiaceae bacterium]|nr:hypothetical protein [Streptosporangiaceae bacterium]